ncbi:Rieske 2Fe-2S domain-containing protein [Rhodococcus sp. LB1]|uniref:Rieske 2Fe-2S domain-containing protein n=1 Tax=Rhodococcus sp. LB1 TaxID=1807499 RepID=UPI00077ACB75|nr:Rieske 2Fe-2S domain-containing protein [Rhodococcus sp. LB1]KXX55882.1 hypothetical protein AZG88_02295 [Rhodococcus sp. LB1]
MPVSTEKIQTGTPESAARRKPGGTISAPAGLGPLIREAWYVIAASEDVGRELSSITVLNEPLVFFRAEDGTPVVLDDRCAHRRFSLAKGHLKGDAIQCGYHGFTFDRTGACVFAPAVSGKQNFGVRHYPAVDRGPWLWVWMGEGAGDRADIPLPDEIEEVEHGFRGYTFNPCNYLMVHENLLDLTHLYYLHGPSVSSEEYANTPPKLLPAPDSRHVGYVRSVSGTSFKLQSIFCGADGSLKLTRTEENWSRGPALNFGWIKFERDDGIDEPVRPSRQMVVHAVTPQTETSTHQFWSFRFNEPLVVSEDEAADAIRKVFAEDIEVLAVQGRLIAEDTRTGVVENSVPSDVPGLRLRRALQRMAAAEKK